MKFVIQGVALLGLGLLATGCKVDKTQSAKAPKVHMNVTGGQLPAYDIKGPDVKVGSKTETFNVPTVHVTPASKRTD